MTAPTLYPTIRQHVAFLCSIKLHPQGHVGLTTLDRELIDLLSERDALVAALCEGTRPPREQAEATP